MRINSRSRIKGNNIILVPYEAIHVLKYHEWMKSEELKQLTASEELTLEQEYQMQASWREDEDKCTFIILDKSLYEKNRDEVESMVGDTNIFVTDKENFLGEIEIMIAETTARRKRYGWEAVILMLLYGINFIKLQKYQAKISITNNSSIKMFEKLGFVEKSRSNVFEEITFEKNVDDEWKKWLHKETSEMEIEYF